METARTILIIGELEKERLSASTRELLGGGRDLADGLQAGLALTFLSDQIGQAAKEAIAYGADQVFPGEDPLFIPYQAEVYLPILEKFIKQLDPEIILLGQTALGRDLAPRLASRLRSALAMDCVILSPDPGTGLIKLTRPVYGSRALAVLAARTRPQMATVRLRAWKAKEPDSDRRGKTVPMPAEIDPTRIRARVVEKVSEETRGIPLEDAEVVVCGGRGLGDSGPFALLEELARLFGGAVGATRPPCDSGWISSSRQIGLTGKIVSPQLYFAVALSGSSQHLAGCQDAKVIVAINKDPEANIFAHAHYGLVGDFRKILPALLARLEEIRPVSK